MARTWLARMKRHENAMEDRLADELLALSQLSATVFSQYARQRTDDGVLVVPNTPAARQNVKDAIWQQVILPYFGTQQNMDGQNARAPFLQLIKDGVEGAVRIQVERHVDLIQKNAPDDVVRFLTGSRAPQFVGEMHGGSHRRTVWYDPWHRFVDENGYTLSDKGWRTSQETRDAIDALLDMHIPLGTSAVDMAQLLEQYLYPEARNIRTRTPYGYDGSYWARRLSRTEITAAAGRSTVNASLLNPFVEMMAWRLSISHPCCDVCDDYAAASPYEISNLPPYPAHPHEMCTISPVVVEDRQARIAQLQAMMVADYDEPFAMGSATYTRRQLQGAFNPDWLVLALMSGAIVRVLRDVYGEVAD